MSLLYCGFASKLDNNNCLNICMDSEVSDSEAEDFPALPCVPSAAVLLEEELSKHSRGFHVCHLNAESLIAHLDDVSDIMNGKLCHVLCISETFLKPTLPDSLAYLSGYKLIRNDRTNKGRGGVAMYVRDDLKFKLIFKSESNYSNKPEILLVEVGTVNGKILIGVIYRPPNHGNLTDIEEALGAYSSNDDHIIVTGDFNCNVQSDTSDVRLIKTIFDIFELNILETQPTCHVKRGNIDSHTTLDLLITRKDKVTNYGQIATPYISIHDFMYLTYSMQTKKYKPKFITYRDLKNIDMDSVRQTAENIDWEQVTNSNNIDDKVELLNKLILSIFDKLAPLKTKRVTRPSAPWMTEEIQTLRRNRDKTLNDFKRNRTNDSELKYKKARNRLKQNIRNTKSAFIKQVTKNMGLRKTWDELKKLGLSKQKPDEETIDININDLNKYFCDLGGKLDDDTKHWALTNITNSAKTFHYEPFTFTDVTEQDTKDAITQIKSKATGADDITITMILIIIDAILPALTDLFNSSLRRSYFPTLWKYSKVRALPKIQNANEMTHYRPINITPSLSKALEKIVLKQMTEYLTRHALLDNLQSGCKSGHSTTTALLKVTDDIRKAMDGTKLTLLTLLDLSAAFNSVDIDLLTSKLKSFFNFSNSAVQWYNSYLVNRHQQLVTKKESSRWAVLDHSVPPGTVLGPILFAMYIQDWTSTLKPNFNHHEFVDDIQIYKHTSLHDLELTIRETSDQLEKILDWTKTNGLILNPTKTQVIVIGTKALRSRVDFNNIPLVSLSGVNIAYSESVKNLGIIIDKNLSWRLQTKRTVKKVYGSLHSLNRMKTFLTTETKKKLVQTLIWPHFDYCDIVQCDATTDDVLRLQICLNSFVRYIFNLKKDCHLTPYFKTLSWLKVKERRDLRIAVEVYKILRDKTPSYLYSLFQYLSDYHSHNTRIGNKLSTPRHITTSYNKSFLVMGSRLWNSIPQEIRAAKSVGSFRQSYWQHLNE